MTRTRHALSRPFPDGATAFFPEVVSSQQSVVNRNEEVKETGGWRRTPSPPKSQILQPLSSRVVGRDAELAQLHGWLAKALSGTRQVVFVLGEPGIGKTTLVDAFLQNLESRVQSPE